MGPNMKKEYQQICLECNKEFRTKRRNKKYCSDKCRNKAWIKLHPRKEKDSV